MFESRIYIFIYTYVYIICIIFNKIVYVYIYRCMFSPILFVRVESYPQATPAPTDAPGYLWHSFRTSAVRAQVRAHPCPVERGVFELQTGKFHKGKFHNIDRIHCASISAKISLISSTPNVAAQLFRGGFHRNFLYRLLSYGWR